MSNSKQFCFIQVIKRIKADVSKNLRQNITVSLQLSVIMYCTKLRIPIPEDKIMKNYKNYLNSKLLKKCAIVKTLSSKVIQLEDNLYPDNTSGLTKPNYQTS